MKNYINALRCCLSTDSTREHLLQPFRQEGHLIASDGKILISVPLSHFPEKTWTTYPEYDEIPVEPKFKAITPIPQPMVRTTTWLRNIFNQAPSIPVLTCNDCQGTGRVIYSYLERAEDIEHELEATCPVCFGTGKNPQTIHGKDEQTAFRLDKQLPLVSVNVTHKLLQVLRELGSIPFTITGQHEGIMQITLPDGVRMLLCGIREDQDTRERWTIITPSQCEESLI